MSINAEELQIILQTNQNRFIMLELLNAEMSRLATITGDCISCNITIDSTSEIRRTCSLSMKVTSSKYVLDSKDCIITMNNMVRVSLGIQDNETSLVRWYNQGCFLFDSANYTYNPSTSELSLSCSDLMMTLITRGCMPEWAVEIVAQESITQAVAATVARGGFSNVNICEINGFCYLDNNKFTREYKVEDGKYVVKTTRNDPTYSDAIPYDLSFGTGCTLYDITDKLVNLYAGYVQYFDVDGTYVVDIDTGEDFTPVAVLNHIDMNKLVSSFSISSDYSTIKNSIKVYGGEGGEFVGIAQDDLIDSPYSSSAVGEVWAVYSGTDEGYSFDSIVSDQQAQEWADEILFKSCRLKDTISFECVDIPFLDVGECVEFAVPPDNITRLYKIISISRDFKAGTMSLQCIRVYAEHTSAGYSNFYASPVITATSDLMQMVVNILPVDDAEKYKIYANGILIGTTTTNSFSYTFAEEGIYGITVRASATGYHDSSPSNAVTLEIADAKMLSTNEGLYITTSDGKKIVLNIPLSPSEEP